MSRDLTKNLNDFLEIYGYDQSRFAEVILARGLIGKIIQGLPKNYIVVCDDNLYSLAAGYFPENRIISLGNEIIASSELVQHLVKNFSDKFLVAFGSGTINDICKYASSLGKSEYYLIPTAASMNGYTSSFASIKFAELNKSIKAQLPKKIFIDMDIITAAPMRLTYSGIGDVLCRINTDMEWWLNTSLFGGNYNSKLFTQIIDLEDQFLDKVNMNKLQNESIELLFELILYSGLTMTVAGGSYPTSQSEHVMAHSLDFLYPEFAKEFLHGEKVAFFTQYSLKIWKKLLQMDDINRLDEKKYTELFNKLQKTKFTQHMVSLTEIYDKKLHLAISTKKMIESKKIHWKKITNHVLSGFENSKYYSQVKILEVVGSRLEGLLSNARIENAINISPFIRDRFTIADLYILTGGRVFDLL